MTALLKKCLSAVGGIGLLIVSLYFSYRVGTGMYYDYFLFPTLKAEDHSIAPTRWQDFAFLGIFWTTVLLSLFAAFRLLRFAMKGRVLEP